MVLQGTIKVSKPVGAAAIPVPPVTTPSLKKEKSNGGTNMVWKEATGINKGCTIVDSNGKLDISKAENPWTEITSVSDVSSATRDNSTKNSSWTDDDKYNNYRRDSRENAEYSDNYPLYKVIIFFSLIVTHLYAGYYLFNIYNTFIIIHIEFALHCNII